MANNVNKVSDAVKDKRARIAILVVTIILSVALIVTGAVSSSVRAPIDGSGDKVATFTLRTSGVNTVSVPNNGNDVYCEINVTKSGYYKVYSSGGTSSNDPRATLYDSSWRSLASNDDSYGYDFSIRYYFSSNSTYYVGISKSSSSSYGSSTLYVYVEAE